MTSHNNPALNARMAMRRRITDRTSNAIRREESARLDVKNAMKGTETTVCNAKIVFSSSNDQTIIKVR